MTIRKQGEWEQLLREMGAVYERPGGLDDPSAPHVGPRLSGHHTSVYLNSSQVVRYPRVVRRLIQEVWMPALGQRRTQPDLIAGYAPYTNDIALALATALDIEYVCATRGDKTDHQGHNVFTSDFLRSDDRDVGMTAVLLADDLVSGGSLRRTTAALAVRGVAVVGPVLCIGNMSGQDNFDGQEIVAAATFEPDPAMFTVADCKAVGFCAIGSESIPNPRNPENWAVLLEHTAPPPD